MSAWAHHWLAGWADPEAASGSGSIDSTSSIGGSGSASIGGSSSIPSPVATLDGSGLPARSGSASLGATGTATGDGGRGTGGAGATLSTTTVVTGAGTTSRDGTATLAVAPATPAGEGEPSHHGALALEVLVGLVGDGAKRVEAAGVITLDSTLGATGATDPTAAGNSSGAFVRRRWVERFAPPPFLRLAGAGHLAVSAGLEGSGLPARSGEGSTGQRAMVGGEGSSYRAGAGGTAPMADLVAAGIARPPRGRDEDELAALLALP